MQSLAPKQLRRLARILEDAMTEQSEIATCAELLRQARAEIEVRSACDLHREPASPDTSDRLPGWGGAYL